MPLSLLQPPPAAPKAHLYAGVGYFEPEVADGGGAAECAARAAAATRAVAQEESAARDVPGRGRTNKRPPPPPPPAVPPSPAAAKAATRVLRTLLTSADAGGGASRADAALAEGALTDPSASPPQHAQHLLRLQHLVSDASGELAAAAAEVTCWQATEMPSELRQLLRDHATSHLRDFENG